MKVGGANGTGGLGGARASRGASGADGFRVALAGQPPGPAPLAGAAAAGGVMGLDALLALQNVGGPLERRRRAVGRAGRILDELDGMRLSLLDGEGVSAPQAERLRRAVRDQREATDDAGLEAVLDDIELRAAVEMAKLEQAARAA